MAPFFPDEGVPFLGVQGFMINAFSENHPVGADLPDRVCCNRRSDAEDSTKQGCAHLRFNSVLEKTDDPDLKAMGEAGANAMPMPNIPEMGSVWSAADNGIALAVTGEQTPEEAMTDAASQVRDLIQGALAGMVNLPAAIQDVAGCGAEWDPACPGDGYGAG